MTTKRMVWWKIVVGAVLVLVSTRSLLYPGSRTLQPDNETQAGAMLFVDLVFLFLGVWLIYRGMKPKTMEPDFRP